MSVILEEYTLLIKKTKCSTMALNRLVALANIEGDEVALNALTNLKSKESPLFLN